LANHGFGPNPRLEYGPLRHFFMMAAAASEQELLKVLTERLNRARKGIILLHDPKAQTAAMLPHFLRYLQDNHYSVVHLVPAASGLDTEHVP